MKSYRQKILVLLAGMLVALLLLEAGLRVVGDVYLHRERRPGVPERGRPARLQTGCEGCKTILCLGDSYTYGMGSSEGKDYPSQLETMLNAGGTAARYTVFNGGKGGANSSMLLDELPGYLEAVEPDLVVVLLGGANLWDYSGYVSHKHRHSARGSLFELIHRIRTIRLVSHLLHKLQQKTRQDTRESMEYVGVRTALDLYLRWLSSRSPAERGRAARSSHFTHGTQALALGQYEAALGHFSKGVKAAPTHSSNYWGMGYANHGLRRHEVAERWYRKCSEINPRDPNSFFGIGQLHYDKMIFGDRREAWFRRGIKADPRFGANYCKLGDSLMMRKHPDHEGALALLKRGIELAPDYLNCYEALLAYYHDHGDKQEMEVLLRRLSKRSRVAESYLAVLSAHGPQAEILSWIKADLNRIVDLIEASGARVVFQLYPNKSPANRIIAEVALDRQLPLVKQLEIFARVAPDARDRKRLFLPDNHCSDEGNRLVAQNLARKIRALGD